MMTMQFTQTRWDALCNRLDVAAHARFPQIAAAYTEPQRAYHTAQHIDECLTLLDSVSAQFQDAALVELCLWLHDLVYEPQRSDNELRSAQIACEWFAALPPARLELLSTYILATKHHEPSQDTDLQALLDIDLAILASEPVRFKQYNEQVRFEYAFVPEAIYEVKRKEFLAHLAARPKLFHHPALAARLESVARKNLA
jgi:predicted metal-dependent HD superfamily phosphohydrolase